MGITAAVLAGMGWAGTLPSGLLGAVVIGLLGSVASPIGLIHRQRLQGAAGCLLAIGFVLSLGLFFLLALVLSKLEDAPPQQWRSTSLILTGSAFASAAMAAAIERRRRR